MLLLSIVLLLQMESSLGHFPVKAPVAMSGESRTYHIVPLEQLGVTKWTHVSTCGKVTLAKKEADGDGHIRLDAAGGHFIVAEVVPYHPIAMPRVGQTVRVKGISRIDKTHRWPEVHPVEELEIVASCAKSAAGSSTRGTTTRGSE